MTALSPNARRAGNSPVRRDGVSWMVVVAWMLLSSACGAPGDQQERITVLGTVKVPAAGAAQSHGLKIGPRRALDRGDGWYFQPTITADDLPSPVAGNEIFVSLEDVAALYDGSGTFANAALKINNAPIGSDRTLTVEFTDLLFGFPERELSGSASGIDLELGGTAHVTITLIEACGTTTSSGGEGVTVNEHNMGVTSGTFQFGWDAFSVPDRFEVLYEGAVLFDTTLISGAGTTSITFDGASTTISVRVTGEIGSGTAWDYSLDCPR